MANSLKRGLYLCIHNGSTQLPSLLFMFRIFRALLLLSSWLPGRAAGPVQAGTATAAPVTIAAAADLKYVLDSLVTIFNHQHPQGRRGLARTSV